MIGIPSTDRMKEAAQDQEPAKCPIYSLHLTFWLVDAAA